ncbi:hypothetical protein NMY22_g12028 [Coprinellus aureogranulatus]|nr:hypothetical protein NMY22_g12028 [Coprinellus aureogranulatus]
MLLVVRLIIIRSFTSESVAIATTSRSFAWNGRRYRDGVSSALALDVARSCVASFRRNSNYQQAIELNASTAKAVLQVDGSDRRKVPGISSTYPLHVGEAEALMDHLERENAQLCGAEDEGNETMLRGERRWLASSLSTLTVNLEAPIPTPFLSEISVARKAPKFESE